MQLFCVSYRIPGLDERSLGDAVRGAGRAFPQLEQGERWAATSVSGEVVIAALHHPRDLVGPRSYRARAGDHVALFDGWPVHRSGRWPGHDASNLLANWSELTEVLEGQFTCLRVDLAADEITAVTDAFGISPLYHASHSGGQLLSNSVEAIRLATALADPSPLGVASLAALGWPSGNSTLLAGVEALAGGASYTLGSDGLSGRPYFTAAGLAADARAGRPAPTEAIARELTLLTSSAVAGGVRADCGITAGRDTRLVLALLLAAGANGEVHYFTGGNEGDGDVAGARKVASAAGLRHELRSVAVLDEGDPRDLVKVFVSQTDGLSSLIQIGDLHEQLIPLRPVGVKLTGLGGEIGRCAVRTGPFAATVPPFIFSAHLQQKLILERARRSRRLLTPDARSLLAEHVRGFVDQRLAEGWERRELGETHYAFDRITRWGSTGVRRLAATDDLFSPYCSRAYARYCFSLTPEERYLEAAHYRLLTALSPMLRDLEFEKPWRRQDARHVRVRASSELVRAVLRRGGRHRSHAHAAAKPYWVTWFDSNLDAHRDLCLSVSDSPLWSVLDRAGVESAFSAADGERARVREALARVLTLFWYFHGRHP
jgi:hypothetical protein